MSAAPQHPAEPARQDATHNLLLLLLQHVHKRRYLPQNIIPAVPCPAGTVLAVGGLTLTADMVPIVQCKVFNQLIHVLHVSVNESVIMVLLIVPLEFYLPISTLYLNGQKPFDKEYNEELFNLYLSLLSSR